MSNVARVVWTEFLPQSPVFKTIDVANRTGMALTNASRDLAKLARQGMVTRVTRGLWTVPGHPDFSPYAVVPHLFSHTAEGGYVSLLSALNLHGMIDQIPRVIHVVTTRQRPRLGSPVGTYEFYRIQRDLFDGFEPYRRFGNFDIATPEKALFDTFYFSARKSRRFAYLPEVELPRTFSVTGFEYWLARIDHLPLRLAVRKRWDQLVAPPTPPRSPPGSRQRPGSAG
jgi:hypothetical protein